MSFRNYTGGGVPGVPPAPLFRENLSGIDYDFMKIKKELHKEFPMLTYEQLMEEKKKAAPPQQKILARLVAMGYQKSANEIIQLIKESRNMKPSSTTVNKCQKIKTLGDDFQKIKLLSVVFSECEEWAKLNVYWRDIILARINLAQEVHEQGDFWLAEKIILGCFEYFQYLNREDKVDRNIIANIKLIIAFLLTEDESSLNKEKQLKAIKTLMECRALTEDNKDRKAHYYEEFLNNEVDCNESTHDIINIRLDRPIGIHGWKNYEAVVATDTVKGSDQSTFHTSSILWSKILVSIANETFWSESERKDGKHHHHVNETVDKLFTQAFELASEGNNITNILNVLYNHAMFLMNIGAFDRARKTFLKLHFRATLFADYETIGLSFSGLGKISASYNCTYDALGHFCNEWEIGWEQNLPVLIIDSTLCMGKILLEEGQLLDAERCFGESYDNHKRLREQDANRIANPNDEDELYDISWAMVGIAAGQALWGKFAGHARNESRIHSLLEWKSYRKPLPKVLKKTFRPKTIVQNKRFADTKRIARKLEIIEIAKTEEIVPMTEEEMEKEWAKLVEEDDHEFAHDREVRDRELESYRLKVMASTVRFNQSLSIAMHQHEDGLLKKHLTTTFETRSFHIKNILSEKIRQRKIQSITASNLELHQQHPEERHSSFMTHE